MTDELVTRTYPAEIAQRAELEGDSDGRTLEVRILPYNVERAADGLLETWAPGSIDTRARPVLTWPEHPAQGGRPIGIAVSMRNEPDGAYATFRVSDTDLGREAVTLARDGVVTGASVGVVRSSMRSDRKAGRVTHRAGTVQHVALTMEPVYETAQVVSIRSQGEAMLDVETTSPPEPDRLDRLEAALETLTTATSTLAERSTTAAEQPDDRADRAGVLPAAAAVTTRSRPHGYLSLGEVIGDIAAARRADQLSERSEAAQRLGVLADAGLWNPDGQGGDELALRAFTAAAATGGTSDAAELYRDLYVPDILENLRQGRASLGLFQRRPRPPRRKSLTLPRHDTVHATVGYQTEGSQVTSTPVETEDDTFAVRALAGGQPVTLEARELTDPSYMDEVVRDLVGAYADKLNYEGVNGAGTTQHLGWLTAATAGSHTTAAGADTFAGLIGKIGTASAKVFAATRRWPTAAIMRSERWGWLVDQVGTDNRPLITTDAPSNPVGIGDATAVGTLRGLAVVLDDDIPENLSVGTDEDTVAVTNARDSLLYEDSERPVVVQLTYPDTLHTDVTVYGFACIAVRRPGAWNYITGITHIT